MKKQIFDFNLNFKERTILYFFIGLICVLSDLILFIIFSNYIPILEANFLAYLIASFSSYLINKKFTFKSSNSRLSLRRYLLVSIIGLTTSQLTMSIGIIFINFLNHNILKIISIIFSAFIQYLGNTFFSNIKK